MFGNYVMFKGVASGQLSCIHLNVHLIIKCFFMYLVIFLALMSTLLGISITLLDFNALLKSSYFSLYFHSLKFFLPTPVIQIHLSLFLIHLFLCDFLSIQSWILAFLVLLLIFVNRFVFLRVVLGSSQNQEGTEIFHMLPSPK